MADETSWTLWPSGSAATSHPAWYRSRVDYTSDSNALQNVDIWLPGLDQAPAVDWPRRDGTWLIFVHGGAWRDPLVDSRSFNASVKHILSYSRDTVDKIAGIASINYSLSPYPLHPTHPAPVPVPGDEGIPGRSAKHPDHIVDVLSAIEFLNSKFGFNNKYILSGHSCGAILSLQVVMDRSQWTSTSRLHDVPNPIAIVGLDGLYDLPALVNKPGDRHQKLSEEYAGFIRLAFGGDQGVWASVSPTSVQDWSQVWPEGKQVILVQSHEDTLVPYSQTELMFKNLRQNVSQLHISEMAATGDHNELWEKGDRIAEILVAVLNSLS